MAYWPGSIARQKIGTWSRVTTCPLRLGTVAMVAAMRSASSNGEVPPGATRRSLSEVEDEEQPASHRQAQASRIRRVMGTIDGCNGRAAYGPPARASTALQ